MWPYTLAWLQRCGGEHVFSTMGGFLTDMALATLVLEQAKELLTCDKGAFLACMPNRTFLGIDTRRVLCWECPQISGWLWRTRFLAWLDLTTRIWGACRIAAKKDRLWGQSNFWRGAAAWLPLPCTTIILHQVDTQFQRLFSPRFHSRVMTKTMPKMAFFSPFTKSNVYEMFCLPSLLVSLRFVTVELIVIPVPTTQNLHSDFYVWTSSRQLYSYLQLRLVSTNTGPMPFLAKKSSKIGIFLVLVLWMVLSKLYRP